VTDAVARTDPAVAEATPVDAGADADTAEPRDRLTLGQLAVVGVPVGALAVLFLVPFGLMLATSFYRRVQGGFYEPAFTLTHWSRLFSDFYLGRTLFSLRTCLLVAALTIAVAFPFTWFLTRMGTRAKVPLLVLILGALTLSEVIVAFSWDLILGRSSGITNILVWLGLMDEPRAFTPGFWSVVAGLSYTAFPYAVLTLFPTLNRIDRELTEAAETLGARPLRTFSTVVVPLCRSALLAAFLLVFVFTLGSYIVAQVLGRPQHWTLAVFISDQATIEANVPFASAIAMFLTVVSLAVVGGVAFVGSRSRLAGAEAGA
jgi:putative spermidine/putrescine transport system permease protein